MTRLLALVLVAGLSGPASAAEGELYVSVAMSLLPATRDAAARFEAGREGVEVLLNAGASGLLAQQALRGAPVDLFLSASPREVERLAGEGLVLAGSRRLFAGNTLVILTPAGSEPPREPGDLVQPRFPRVAIGNPKTAPVGRYAREALAALGIWESLRPRMVFGENARQVLEYVARGEVSVAVLYRSDARILPGKVALGPELPLAPGSRIAYEGAVLADARRPELARDFLHFLTSAEGREILDRHGFAPPPGGP